jgi:PKD repeat protein
MKSFLLSSLLLAVIVSGCSKSSNSNTPASAKVETPAPPALSAKFSVTNTINNDGVKEGDDVKFENQSVSAVSYLWDFGYGFTSTEKSPVFQFGCGNRSVTLTVTGADGSSISFTKDLLVYCKGKNAGGKNANGQAHTGNTGE